MSGSDSGSFVYDAHRRRVRQDINGETIYSVYTSGGAMVYRHNATTGEATDYLRLGGRTIARLATSGGATTVTYTHSDHLGSPAAATNASGALLWREDYTPFGEARQAPAANADGESFTGHITDSDTGVVYMQARYYDPAIGRFLSDDPVGFAQGGVGYFNRYAYVGNNPLNATDPSGEESYLVSRPVVVFGIDTGRDHMFVVVTDGPMGEVTNRYSYAPSRSRDGQLVSHSASNNQGTATNVDDVGAYEALRNAGADAAAEQGITFAQIDAADDAVIASGEAVDQTLGTIEEPGLVEYDMLPNENSNGANSNSAAMAVANRANPAANQPVPNGANPPGAQFEDRIPQ
jgi:RHS repeat-associated protein